MGSAGTVQTGQSRAGPGAPVDRKICIRIHSAKIALFASKIGRCIGLFTGNMREKELYTTVRFCRLNLSTVIGDYYPYKHTKGICPIQILHKLTFPVAIV